MEIKVIAGDITKTEAGAIILGLFEGVKRPAGELAVVDKALGGAVSQLISQVWVKRRTYLWIAFVWRWVKPAGFCSRGGLAMWLLLPWGQAG
jgi:hypothetical protein